MNRDMEINGEIVNEEVRYADLNLSPELMRAIDKKGYVQATPVQAGAIPLLHGVEGRDREGPPPERARPLPSVSLWSSTPIPRGTQVTGLVLAPTRELAIRSRTS